MESLEIPPFSGNKAKKLVILFHGLASNGEDLLGLVPFFHKGLPDVHFYSPNGVEEFDMGPYGYQWFSLRDREYETVKQNVYKSEQKIISLIEKKLLELDLGYEDLTLIGFSQGAMLSLYLAHKLDKKIQSVVAFSGAFYPPEIVSNKSTPICLIHGMQDEVVSFDSLSQAENILREIGTQVEVHGLDNLGHSIDLRGIEIAQNFIIKHMR
ncbi:MAG: dienelactone hydrolase family protein [Rickettsiaceae bacterium]|nr:dienelactone hydrolase family protein [Rickettsiaceae bacterium]